MFGIAIMMNNYLHDVATALLATSAVTLLVFGRVAEKKYAEGAQAFFADSFDKLTRLAIFSLVWIIVGGAIRAYYYREFEWANAVGKSQVPALLVKHVIMFTLTGVGIWGWSVLRRRVRAYRLGEASASVSEPVSASVSGPVSEAPPA